MKKKIYVIAIFLTLLFSLTSIGIITENVKAQTGNSRFTYNFTAEWNLITIPLIMEDSSFEGIFSDLLNDGSISNHYFSYDPVNQKYIVNPNTLEPGYAYWVYLYDEVSYQITGDEITDDLSVTIGYPSNMIGWVHEENITAEDICQTIPGCESVSKSINGSQGQFLIHYPGEVENNFLITKGMGFWISVSEESIWDGSADIGENNPPYTPNDPSPPNEANDIDINNDLCWNGGDPDISDIITYDVYFGTVPNPGPDELVSPNQENNMYKPYNLDYNTPYYWRIVSKDNHGVTKYGPIWSFTTGSFPNDPPNIPSNPLPQNGSNDIDINTDLSWEGGDPDMGDSVTYDVYFGTDPTPDSDDIVSHDQDITSYNPGTLIFQTHYYWMIIARDSHNATTYGDVWEFTTEDSTNYYALSTSVGSGSGSVSPSSGSYPAGEVVTLTATADSGYVFDEWSSNVDDPSSSVTTITMNSNKMVTAYFEEDNPPPDQYTLTVYIQGTGSVSKNPDLPVYDSGTPVTLTATASSGYVFDEWQGDDIDGSNNQVETITMNSDKSVTAVFTEKNAGLSISCKQINIKELNVTIENLEPNTLSNLQWNINMTGGLLNMVNLSSNGVISNLDTGSLESIVSDEFGFGLGLVSIKIEVNVSGEIFEKEKNGIILGRILLIF